ncbi:MAG: dienelactone hydrolase family protein [Bryobacteraceae bacterium]
MSTFSLAATSTVTIEPWELQGDWNIPRHAYGVVVFCHGTGSSRMSPRNRAVARRLNEGGLATLLFDLLNREEEAEDNWSHHLRFDIPALAERVVRATDWVGTRRESAGLPTAYFGASTGAAAALVASVACAGSVKAIVSRGGRPDLAGDRLGLVRAPVLLIVGGSDTEVLRLNRKAQARMKNAETRIAVVPGATHLFEEPGALDEVTQLALDWFSLHLRDKPASTRW